MLVNIMGKSKVSRSNSLSFASYQTKKNHSFSSEIVVEGLHDVLPKSLLNEIGGM
jgi:hypothetical protein